MQFDASHPGFILHMSDQPIPILRRASGQRQDDWRAQPAPIEHVIVQHAAEAGVVIAGRQHEATGHLGQARRGMSTPGAP